jgi:hypothetical protein
VLAHQATGAHRTILAAGTIVPDGTGLHHCSAVEGGFDTFGLGKLQQSLNGWIYGLVIRHYHLLYSESYKLETRIQLPASSF